MSVFGKQIAKEKWSKDHVLTILSFHVNDISLKVLRKLETLGISDPIQDKRKINTKIENEIDFQDN